MSPQDLYRTIQDLTRTFPRRDEPHQDPPLRNFPGPYQEPPKPCHQGTCYPATSHLTLSFQQPATCIRSTWHRKWPGGMREACKSATPRFTLGEGRAKPEVKLSYSIANLHFQSPFPVSIYNLHFQSPIPISTSNLHFQSPLQISTSNLNFQSSTISNLNFHPQEFCKEICKRLSKRLASPPPTRGGTPLTPQRPCAFRKIDHFDHNIGPFFVQNR